MNFCWVTLHVRNFDKSLEFYHDVLCLPICSRHGADAMQIAMLGEENQPKIELLFNSTEPDKHACSGISIGLTVSYSLEETTEYLRGKNIPILRGPIAPNPHIRFMFITDPDGYEVQLVENL
jgi:lactoylglutathione lyase